MSLEFAEGQVTRLRREMKLLFNEAETKALCARLAAEMGGVTPEVTQITSVYFDRPGYPLADRAMRTPHECLKVRTKEYFPDLGDGQGLLNRVVLEAKRERNGMTQKRRAWLPREDLITAVGAKGKGRVQQLITKGALLPVLAVSYLREVYQPNGSWRVTVDRQIEFFRVTGAQVFGPQRLSRERLGAAMFREDRSVVELKFMGGSLPAWLTELGARRSERYSKFGTGMAGLLGSRADGVLGG